MDTALHDLNALFEPVLGRVTNRRSRVRIGQGGDVAIYIVIRMASMGRLRCQSRALELPMADPFQVVFARGVFAGRIDSRTPAHFARFVDNRVKVELQVPRDGRKRYTGMRRRMARASSWWIISR
jgi:hypothetical protein